MNEETIKPSIETYLSDLSIFNNSEYEFRARSQRIMELEATPSEVCEWYHIQDPLDELRNLSVIFTAERLIDDSDLRSKIKANQEKGRALEIGAALILVGIFDPAFKKKWQQSIIDFRAGNTSSLLDYIEIINYSLNIARSKDKKLSLQELEQLSIAGSMLNQSSRILFSKEKLGRFSKKYRGSMEAAGIKFYPQEMNIFNQFYSKEIFLEVFARGRTSKDPKERIVGLEALWKANSSILGNALDPISKGTDVKELRKLGYKNIEDARKDAIFYMVEELESVFLRDNGILYNKDIEKSFIKGKLYELIWFLDFQILSEINKDNQVIYTAFPFEDRPKAGKTDINRGFDYYICFGDAEYFIQLKANTGTNKKRYHGLIELIEEENFMDIEPRRLWAKLKYYRQLIACGFNETIAPNPKKYILPTVIEAKDIISKEGGNATMEKKTAELYGIKSFIPPEKIVLLNRAARRRLQRKNRKESR